MREELRRGFIAKSMATSFLHIFKPRVTIQYPTQKKEIPDGYKGMPVLYPDCTGCSLCAGICPNKCIDMVEFDEQEKPALPPHLPKQAKVIDIMRKQGKEKKYKVPQVRVGRCMFCGLCEEVCPVNVIRLSKRYEVSERSVDSLILTPECMLEEGSP